MRINFTIKDVRRFYSYIRTDLSNSECWIWIGGRCKKSNRGRFWIDGETRTASVVSFLIHNKGIIHDGLYVCHICDNPICVNPEHLFLGSHSDNMKDMYQKGRRVVKGERAPAHKLTESDVSKIRRLYDSGKYFQYQLADMFGVHQSNISLLVNKKTFVESL